MITIPKSNQSYVSLFLTELFFKFFFRTSYFPEFQPGVGDWAGPNGGCCGGGKDLEIEKIKRVRRPLKE